MSDFVKDGKVFGIIPVGNYTKIIYLLVLGASVLGLLLTVLALAGVSLGLGTIISIAGFAGLLLAVLGLVLLSDDFSPLDRSHFIYVIAVWLVMFLVIAIIGSALAGGYLGLIVTLALTVVQAILLYAGYNSLSRGRAIDKDNFKSEIQLALKRS